MEQTTIDSAIYEKYIAPTKSERRRFIGIEIEMPVVNSSHGYSASELQRLFARKELPDFVDKEQLKTVLRQILDISSDGLKQRGKNEEIFLKPLYERADTLSNPAKDMLDGIENGETMEDYIKIFALAQR